ncbi:MAG: protease HtpX [Gammaproteobacteria bacterium]|nr:protease HtpX [Gammaproteobacteria bacterium]
MRILLFVATNLAIVFVLNITLSLFGVEHYLAQTDAGINITGLLIISAAFGMIGAFVSLALSKTLAKRSMGVRVISGRGGGPSDAWLAETVARQAKAAGIAMPEVGVFPSPQPNAFATGMFRNKALVAVSEGLLAQMERDEVEAVLGHEVSHIANGDMVTLALIQGVVNTFVIFLSRLVGHVVDRAVFKSRGFGPGYFITVIVTQIVLSIFATMIVMWFSRRREFRADEGGAKLAGRGKMIAALKQLQRRGRAEDLPGEMAAFGISGGVHGGIRRLLMSHPPLEQRIAALEKPQ